MRPRVLVVAAALVAAPAAADWIVYVGGGLAEIEGTWELRGRQVIFHSPSGTLLSARAEDVDLPASAFLSWQVGSRKRPPGAIGAAGAKSAAPASPGEKPVCVPARLRRVVTAETLELEAGGRTETVHLTCVDTPETLHRFPELAGYGVLAASAVESRAAAGADVCVVDESPPRLDRQGHRIVYVRLADGGDLGAELVGGGYGLARRVDCGLGASYVELERRARVAARGLWGPAAEAASVAVMARASAFHAVPPPARSSGSS
jgi:endonuclease YncB( thermonuclease family)